MEEQKIKRCVLLYMEHATRKAQKAGKHPYDPCAVVANFNFPERMKAIVTEIEQAKAGHNACNVDALLDLLYIGGTTKAVIKWKKARAVDEETTMA